MGLFSKIITIFISIGVGWISYVIYRHLQPPVPPAPLPETRWGPGEVTDDVSIRPFEIHVDDKVLQDLRHRLDIIPKFNEPLEDANFMYGFNTKTLSEIVDFWKTKYNWRAREQLLNKYPHYKTNIQGLDIHFIHVKPKATKGLRVLPLLLLHGWPGSVREFWDLIPLLTTPRPQHDFVFELIVPSLPGYGFSDGAVKQGMGPAQVAVVMKNLMKRVGFDKFYVQGGDWGAIIASNLATLFPDNIIGHHSNMCVARSAMSNLKTFIGAYIPSLVVDKEHESKMYPFFDKFKFLLSETGYMHIQATKPDTIGIALRDSPVGLAAYILEKFSTWTNPAWINLPDGGLTKKYSYADLLDNIMIYWITNSITTSMRLYAEYFSVEQMSLELDGVPTAVPTACVRFPNDLTYTPDSILKLKFLNLVQSNDMLRGGHFAAFEEPNLLADDVWSAVHTFDIFYKTAS